MGDLIHMDFDGELQFDTDHDEFMHGVEKPCVPLGWCPYGPLVEDFPLHPKASAYAEEHGRYKRWDPTPHGRRPDGSQYPGSWVDCGPGVEGAIPDIGFGLKHVDEPHSCSVFGHDCPAFYVAEPFLDDAAWGDADDEVNDDDLDMLRCPGCIVRAEQELSEKVWYDRHQLGLILVADGRREASPPEIAERAEASASRIREEHGIEHLGPYSDFEWGMLNGKLSALRWVLGEEWDMLDS